MIVSRRSMYLAHASTNIMRGAAMASAKARAEVGLGQAQQRYATLVEKTGAKA